MNGYRVLYFEKFLNNCGDSEKPLKIFGRWTSHRVNPWKVNSRLSRIEKWIKEIFGRILEKL